MDEIFWEVAFLVSQSGDSKQIQDFFKDALRWLF